ncbi:MAG: response regulator transcription factor [Acetatifactor sp.]|nr:response regulator transcription factor [Acetatifactor sp.]
MYRLLIVEDDFGIANEMKAWVEKWDMEALIAEDFREVTAEYARFQPHIILLDITLPFYDGYYWCREIRKISNVPIVFLSSAADNMNIIMAMNMGADDFVPKPFDRNVLMAKIQALLRRSYDFAGTVPVLEHRGAFLNMGDNTLTFGEERIPLTQNEYRILLCLMESKGSVVSREKLMERLWETEQFVDENTLTVNVNRLRKKLDAAGLEHFIQTKFGVGYLVE